MNRFAEGTTFEERLAAKRADPIGAHAERSAWFAITLADRIIEAPGQPTERERRGIIALLREARRESIEEKWRQLEVCP